MFDRYWTLSDLIRSVSGSTSAVIDQNAGDSENQLRAEHAALNHVALTDRAHPRRSNSAIKSCPLGSPGRRTKSRVLRFSGPRWRSVQGIGAARSAAVDCGTGEKALAASACVGDSLLQGSTDHTQA